METLYEWMKTDFKWMETSLEWMKISFEWSETPCEWMESKFSPNICFKIVDLADEFLMKSC
jgi:hypothetical protein